MTKTEVIRSLAKAHHLSQPKTKEIVEDFISTILCAATEGSGRFWWPGFGTFTKRTRKARMIRNPRTNEPMQLPETKTINFRPAEAVREALR